jgi:hypothetical protein
MPQNTEQAKKRKVSIFAESDTTNVNFAGVYRGILQEYLASNPNAEIHTPETSVAVSELYQARLRELEAEAMGRPVIRDSTFIKEAEKFKDLNPDLDISIFPFHGKNELSESLRVMQQQVGQDSVDIGIFGHAGDKFGGVKTNEFADLYNSTGEDCSKVGGVYIGSCSYAASRFDSNREDLANTFKAPVKAQTIFWKGARARTLTEERKLREAGADQLGSRLFTPYANVKTTEYKKTKPRPKYIEPTISRPGVFDAPSSR